MKSRRLWRFPKNPKTNINSIASMSEQLPPTETIRTFCVICNSKQYFDSWESIDLPCKRNTFFCRLCGSNARNRHLVKVLLDYFKYDSIYDFVGNFQGKVWVAEAQGPLVEKLSAIQDFVSSEFLDDVPSGYRLNEILCQDLTQTSFPDNYFDVIITQDVLEHVADAQRAVEEIFRILRPGGIHICTVPVQWDLQETLIRASVISGKLTHHLEPVFHGDPIRSDGALAYTDFGSDICLKFLEKIGKTVIYTSNANLKDQKKFAIYNNWVFVSTKPLINLDLTLNKT